MIDKEQAAKLLSEKKQPGPTSRFTKEVMAARVKEQKLRASTAYGMAGRALRRLHPDDFDMLYRTALEQQDAKRGPLPGDQA